MKLKIFDSILFGSLQPFAIENQEDKKFKAILNPSLTTPSSVKEFNKALTKIFVDHPNLIESVGYNIKLSPDKNELVISNMKDKVFEPLIDLDLPPHFNATTEYYYYLIKNEATRVIRSLVKEVEAVGNEVDAKYILINCINDIEYLLRNVARELKALPNTDFPFYQPTGQESDIDRVKMNTHHVYYTLKITLIRLYFETLTTFSRLLGNIGKTEDELYMQVLGETPPKQAVNELSKKMAIRQAEIFVVEKNFTEIRINHLLNELQNYYSSNKSDKKLQAALSALENLLFIKKYTESQKQYSFEDLHSAKLSNSIFNDLKAQYRKEVEQLSFGHERFDKIEEIIDNLIEPPFNTFDPSETLKYSIARRIMQWLNTQQDLYKANFTKKFSSRQIKSSSNKKFANPANKSVIVSDKSFTYKYLATNSDNLTDLFDSLKKNGFISKDTTLHNFKKVFSGKEIDTPIVWTGNMSDLNYFVKLIHNKNKLVVDLKQHQWKVTCKCFVQHNGQKFDRIKLKQQKKPKSTFHLLENAVRLI